MGGPRDDHAKWSKSDKDKYHLISLICLILIKIMQMNLFTKTEIDSQTLKTNLSLPKRKRDEGRDKLRFWN